MVAAKEDAADAPGSMSLTELNSAGDSGRAGGCGDADGLYDAREFRPEAACDRLPGAVASFGLCIIGSSKSLSDLLSSFNGFGRFGVGVIDSGRMCMDCCV